MAIGNLARPLALIPAGASLVIFLLAHLSIGASHYDDLRAPIAKATTFEMYLRQNFTFQLVDNGNGEMEFIHVAPAPRAIDFDDEED